MSAELMKVGRGVLYAAAMHLLVYRDSGRRRVKRETSLMKMRQ